MKSLILAVCLVAIQTSPPAPRQTPNGSTNTSDGVENQGQKNQKPANSIPQVNDSVKTATQTPNSKEPENKNKEDQNVRVVGQPLKIAVNRDRIDWSVWAFSFLLVVVGALQFIVLLRQANISKWQANIAERQRLQMIEAGQQTERIIAQMKDTTVRQLRAYVGISKVFLNLGVPTRPIASVEIQNFGQTPAYKVRQSSRIDVNQYPPATPLPDVATEGEGSMSIIPPGIKQTALVALGTALPQGVPIGNQAVTIYARGKITYEDAFGVDRYVTYRFIYGGPTNPTHMRNPEGVLLGAMIPDTTGNDAD